MSRSSYSKDKCWLCGKYMSTAGFAVASHMRRHVREGRLIEVEYHEPPFVYRREFLLPEEAYKRLKKPFYRYVSATK